MISSPQFYKILLKNRISFFTGVPDSLLSEIVNYLCLTVPQKKHFISANEGGAIAAACGYHFATGRIALCYMQNSGLGNAVNPLLTLADKNVYRIPVLLLIGWRGEPGQEDEPQHATEGKITRDLLHLMGIPCEILPQNIYEAQWAVKEACNIMKKRHIPFALLVRKGTFIKESKTVDNNIGYKLTREEALKIILPAVNKQSVIVATTGMTSRELFDIREKIGQSHKRDFLTIGSMGHASSIALGIALKKPKKQIICLDGDGSVVMQMGAMAVIASQNIRNFIHIVLNNGVHDSVGGQPTAGLNTDLVSVAKACGYACAVRAITGKEIIMAIESFNHLSGPSFLEIKIHPGARADLGRPTGLPVERKTQFMKYLST